MSDTPDWLHAARDHWRWRGRQRPPFAIDPGPGQVSVWDFPRPPALVRDPREAVVRWGTLEIARSRSVWCVLETAHPPTVYLPWTDVQARWLQPAGGGSFCEWKGPARYWSLVDPAEGSAPGGRRRLERVAWSYPQPLAGAEPLADCVAFYPNDLDCTLGGEAVRPQPGGFYGGWVTPELVGPFKGEAGTTGW
jgi:uncharacterized protein (DUF427 family)